MSDAEWTVPTVGAAEPDFLSGGGQMGALMRSTDWSKTPLGPLASWSPTLRMMVKFLLANRFPLLLWWRPDYVQIYNDAYIPVPGKKHPRALGQPARECWAEIWHVIGPLIDTPFRGGPATWSDDLELEILRHGFVEETHFTVAYSPVPDPEAAGGIGGVLATVHEITPQVIQERRVRVLRDLGAPALAARKAEEACSIAAEVLSRAPRDVPFALIYLFDPDAERARLVATAGVALGTAAAPEVASLDGRDPAVWPIADVFAARRLTVIDDLRGRVGNVPPGPWADAPHEAVAVPIASHIPDRLAGVLIAGVSARIALDDLYQSFFELAAAQIATAIANARAYEGERKRAEALAEIDRAKTAFFSNVSHEFRTPLTLLLGPIEDALADTRTALPPAHEDRLRVAHRNSLRLLKLVNTLLDFSRIEAGRVQATYEATDLAAYTAELASVFRSAIERAGLQLVIDCDPLAEAVYVDREMWEKVVLNLVSNALKFTFEGGIAVALRAVGDTVVLTVRDTGTGIPAEELPHLFERFHRVEGARGRTQEGSGIGLALVQELVKLHGGTVRAESTLGAGATFFVSLPLGAAHLPAERIGAGRSLASTALGASPFIEEAMRWLPDTGDLERDPVDRPPALDLARVPARDDGRSAGARPRVLLADDNADMREYVRRLLSASHDVVAVADGIAALEAARARVPDLVLTDVMMPRLDGFGLLRALRDDPITRPVPVILLSARAGEESRVEGLEAGADDYLIKPFSARELLARVHAHLEIARARQQAIAVERDARREAEAANREKGEMLALVEAFEASAPIGYALLDADLRFVRVNEALASMNGVPVDAHVGRSVEEVLGTRWRTVVTVLRQVLDTGETLHREVSGETPAAGGMRHYEATYYPVRMPDGRVLGVGAAVIDVTERKRLEDDRARLLQAERVARAEAEAANRAKDEFLAMLGHELRNPLGALASAGHVVQAADTGKEAARRARAVIGRQVAHLTRLVDDLLEVSRVTMGRVVLTRQPLELAALVSDAMATQRAAGRFERHRMSMRLSPVWVEGDETRLEQILINLVSNALKYTPAGGAVTVSVGSDGEAAVLEVADSGIGIPGDLIDRVFDLFVQGSRGLDRALGGLGIGLTLVKRLVEMHGGTVTAASGGAQPGTLFIVRLPRTEAPAHVPAPGPAARISARPRRVLIVEDNDDAREMLGAVLRLHGHEVHAVAEGALALDLIGTVRPEVALVDVGLPGLDGYEVARRLRAAPGGDTMLLVAITGYGQAEDRERALAAGFDVHLTKPVAPERLAAVIADDVKGREP